MTFRTFLAARRRLVLAVAGAAASLAMILTGCAGEADPVASGSETATASESATATPSVTPTATAAYKAADAKGKAENVPVPALPEAAKAETKEGLEAFARYWFQLMGYAYETGDVAPLAAATGPNCEMCNSVMRIVPKAFTNGSWLVGGSFSTPVVESNFKPQADETIPVTVQVVQTQIRYCKADGAEYRSPTEATNTANVAFLKFVDGAWKLYGVNPLQ